MFNIVLPPPPPPPKKKKNKKQKKVVPICYENYLKRGQFMFFWGIYHALTLLNIMWGYMLLQYLKGNGD